MSTLPPQSPTSPLPKRQKISPSKSISTPITTTNSTTTSTSTPTAATTKSSSSLQEIMSSNTATNAATTAPAPTPTPNGTTSSTTSTAPPTTTTSSTTTPRSRPSNLLPPPSSLRNSPRARLPTRGSAFAAGYDIYAAKDTVVPAKGKAMVDTDISMAVPDGTYGRIAPRSGLASKHMIDTGAGVIDADYRGQVKVLLFNHGEKDYEVKEGDRVAQLILERIYTPEVTEVLVLEESVRGEGGFGSTG
ncbi:0a2c19c7-3ad5-4bea-8969-2308a8c4e32c [Sclerotinia trifoliorum]|uniref:Deoxyuridine 5'-triphosphate nucleotidohydrolase n=1 Tax=Sclerotinia trifoliorum TaxID=28548 RepID=A0A8H2VNJ6_9HELO|nr:0a2c19c7-3ad5-4bea-8969-2308a8c4e32c [Sclerotinia trifoliorum]